MTDLAGKSASGFFRAIIVLADGPAWPALALLVAGSVTAIPSNALAEAAQRYENGRLICSERVDTHGTSAIVSFSQDGSDRRALLQEGLNILPSVSRDGQRIVFSRRTQEGSIELFEMPVDGGPLTQLTHDTRGGNLKAVYSPDGSRIAFMSARHETGHPEVWIMNVDGSDMKQLTWTTPVDGQQEIRGHLHVSSGHPSFSPDGKELFYSSTQSGSVQIWVMSVDGSRKRRLTSGFGDDYPQANVPNVSLNGNKIVFWSGFEGRYGEVWLANAAGLSSPERLTETEGPANSDDPFLSPDGNKVVYGRGVGGDRAMYIFDMESKTTTLLAEDMQYCSWQPIPHY